METPIGSESAEKARQELAGLMGKCDIPDRGIEIPGLGIYKKHHFAIVTANKELLQDLLKGKQKLDDTTLPSKTNSMHLAAVFSTPAIMKILADAGYAVDSRDLYGNTPLMSAVPHVANMSFLIGRGADVNLANAGDRTPLALAVVNNSVEAAELLIEHGASACFKDSDGEALLDMAKQRGTADNYLISMLEREYQKQSCDKQEADAGQAPAASDKAEKH
ncbi:MAG TPA: ankyrin repeat domain-containing protein [Gammaproteobacteria bacterium]|nr:ankyrin repeat domain-containing protein [Gammaproteobacteria bacterium]